MRLTNSDRDAFVRAVMDDVPDVDYNEQARRTLTEWAIKQLPDPVRAIYKTHPRYVKHIHLSVPGYEISNPYVPGDDGLTLDLDMRAWCAAMSNKIKQQSEARKNLREKLKGAIYSCTTLKMALELLPEFAKYLPQERDGKVVRTMPVVANLVADLAKAGWPKGKVGSALLNA